MEDHQRTRAAAELIAQPEKNSSVDQPKSSHNPLNGSETFFKKYQRPSGSIMVNACLVLDHPRSPAHLSHAPCPPALQGMPPHAIKEYAGHRSFIETERYLKYMPQQIALGANNA